MRQGTLALLILALLTAGTTSQAQSLRGSHASMQRQNHAAVRYGYSFLETPSEVRRFVKSGYLVTVHENRDLELHNVSYPYARAEVKLFLERLGSQYHRACGERLIVTSLTRPIDKQPGNASENSVHPAGMAADLRVPRRSKCRSWLEKTLLSLERTGVLDVTREHYPAHYHVAVFTKDYESYVAALQSGMKLYVVRRGDSLSRIAHISGSSVARIRSVNNLGSDLLQIGQKLQIPLSSPQASSMAQADARGEGKAQRMTAATHKVRRGDTLWSIANRYGTTVSMLRRDNGLSSNLLHIGQELKISMTMGSR